MLGDGVASGGTANHNGENDSATGTSPASDRSEDCIRVRMQPPLPCALDGCGRPAADALAEPDPDHPGLWTLLPICADCANRLRSQPDSPREQTDGQLNGQTRLGIERDPRDR